MASLLFRTLIDRGTNEFLKRLSLHLGTLKGPRGRAGAQGEGHERGVKYFLCLSGDCFLTLWSDGCCLTPIILAGLCVGRVIWAFSWTGRLPNLSEMPYVRMPSAVAMVEEEQRTLGDTKRPSAYARGVNLSSVQVVDHHW